MRVLVLNQDYTFLGITSWQNAVSAVYSERAITESEYDEEVHSVSMSMKIPAVIRLKNFVRVAYEKVTHVSFTKHNVYIRDNFTCQYCGEKKEPKKLSIDHLIPESRNGKTSWENCVAACHSCNMIKDNRTPQEAGMHLIRIPGKPKGFRTILKIKLGEIHKLWFRYLGIEEE